MKAKGLLRIILILLVLSVNIGCDQVSKSIVRHKMNDYDRIGFLHDHFTLLKVENTGAFLSVGDSLSGPFRIILLNFLPMLAIVAALVFVIIRKNLDRTTLFSIILIIGGGFGNIFDRIIHGSVTDFMHINFGIFQTGVFNVADVSIMTGMFILLFHTYFKKPAVVETTDTNHPN